MGGWFHLLGKLVYNQLKQPLGRFGKGALAFVHWMARHVVFAVLAVTLFLQGCSWFFPSYDARIMGTVVNATGGQAVVDSYVWIHSLTSSFTATARTDGFGRFSVGVPVGRYELKLSKAGYGSSHVIGLNVQGPTAVQILQREVFNPRWSARAPVVTLRGVDEGDRFLGEIPYRVSVQADNDVQYIYVALGKTPGSSFLSAPRQIFEETPLTGEQAINPKDYGVRGDTTFQVVVYDLNGNRTHLIRNITVLPDQGDLSPPQDLRAVAVTLGKQVSFFSQPDPALEAAPQAGNLYVELSWEPSPTRNIEGYRLYRSFNGAAYARVVTLHPDQTVYRDGNASLSVGQPVYYRLAAFRGGDESDWSEVVSVTPLPPFDVRLISPADDAIEVSRTPQFRWEPTRQVGRHQIYAAILWDSVLGEQFFWITPEPPDFLNNQRSWRWNQDGRMRGTPWETLQSQRLYEWEIVYAVAVDDLAKPTAVSIAVDRLGLEHPNIPITPIGVPASDNFSFTTGN